jgi:hypothetical protein
LTIYLRYVYRFLPARVATAAGELARHAGGLPGGATRRQMPMKIHSKKSSVTTPKEGKAAVLRYYHALQREFAIELQNAPTDWDHLSYLHFEIADLELRAPWLRKEASHEAR